MNAVCRLVNNGTGALLRDVCPCCQGEGVLALLDERGDFDLWGQCHECRGTGESFIPEIGGES